MKPEQKELCSILRETILLLCRNGLTCDSKIRVQGLIGITVDAHQVFLVQLDETVRSGDVIGHGETLTSKPCVSSSVHASCEQSGAPHLPPEECSHDGGRRRHGATMRSATVTQTDLRSQAAYVDGTINSDVITIADDEDDVIGTYVKPDMSVDGPDVSTCLQVSGFLDYVDQSNVEYLASSRSHCGDQFDEYVPDGNLLSANAMGTDHHCTARGPVTSGRGRTYRLGHRLHVKQVSLQIEQNDVRRGFQISVVSSTSGVWANRLVVQNGCGVN